MKLSIVKRNGKQFFNVHVHHKPVFKNWINLNRLTFWIVTYIIFVATSIVISKSFESVCRIEPIQQVEIKAIPVPTVTKTPVQSWVGKVSYYSHDGCLGCGVNQITASGEKFDEMAMTLAFNRLPMKTMVLVTNLDTGTSIVAKTNDRGGFEKYNRIADLSKGLFLVLGAKTDVTKIKIERL